MHLVYNDINDAFEGLVCYFGMNQDKIARTSSRVGEVLQIIEPVTITYKNPIHRVLFNEARDANPYFHLFEAIWMLAGRRDIEPMAYYAANYRDCVQDGDNPNANGAYGHRWRSSEYHSWEDDRFNGGVCVKVDQLKVLIDHFKRLPNSRRAVLQMWNVEDDLLRIGSDLDFMQGKQSKDVCCNTHAYFLINNGRLDMTVCNRSNDLIWGALGANVVHFSFLQEYLAANIGVPVGVYNQITNNMHVYTSRWEPEKWSADTTPNYYSRLPRMNGVALIQEPKVFEGELGRFNYLYLGRDLVSITFAQDEFTEPFFRSVAKPAAIAFYFHKARNYVSALTWANQIYADDWRTVCVGWLRRRQASFERAKDDGVTYEDNRNPYLVNHLRRKESIDASSIAEEK